MDKRFKFIAILAGGSILSSEVMGEIGNEGPYWIAPDHSHIEIPEGNVASAYSRPVEDSSTATASTTRSTELLKRFGYPFPIIR